MTTDNAARPVRELLDHCAASVERLQVAVRRGLPPEALHVCTIYLWLHDAGLRRLVEEMAPQAMEPSKEP